MDLSDPEIRVLGCLLEKQRTTPDQYPLTLNSLRLACNQATNRDPVVDYDEATLREALRGLERRGYTRFTSGHGSRAAKHRHLLAEALPMSDGERALVCVLMLRGPQTPGELKQRSERLHHFGGLESVHETLAALIERGLVARIERSPGQKEERYAQLLGADAAPDPRARAAPGPQMHATPDPQIHAVGDPLTRAASGPRAHAATAAGEDAGDAPPETPAPRAATGVAGWEDLHDRVARLEREVAELRSALVGG
jgi:uncharacterized protein